MELCQCSSASATSQGNLCVSYFCEKMAALKNIFVWILHKIDVLWPVPGPGYHGTTRKSGISLFAFDKNEGQMGTKIFCWKRQTFQLERDLSFTGVLHSLPIQHNIGRRRRRASGAPESRLFFAEPNGGNSKSNIGFSFLPCGILLRITATSVHL